MKTGIELIADERKRQVEKEGWDVEHDREHEPHTLSGAAICYAQTKQVEKTAGAPLKMWPFSGEWWKPKSRLRNLVRAGALIAAEIDRLYCPNCSGEGKLWVAVLNNEKKFIDCPDCQKDQTIQ